jgi:plasmid stabilization system protein ParE
MVQINWTNQAIQDLKDIGEYIAKDSEHCAKLQVVKIKARVQILKSHPQIGFPVAEYNNKHVRQLLQGKIPHYIK